MKNVYKTEAPVCGVWTDQLPSRPDLRRVMVVTNGRLLHFVGKTGKHGSEGGGSIFSRLFETESPSIHEAGPASGVPPSALAVTPDTPNAPGSEDSSPERIFGWLSSQGLLHGKLLVSPTDSELGTKLFNEARWRPNSSSTRPKSASGQRAHFVALTQWHVLQMNENRLIATNRLDDSLVFDQAILDSGQKPLALLADMKKNTFWLFTSQDIFEVEVQDEDRDVWKILMKQHNFEDALQYANNSAQKNAVATASGDYLIEQGQYMEAAKVYGKSTKPFEQVSLAFIDKRQKDALRQYLLTKLASQKKSAIMQKMMLAIWLTELFMAKLDLLEDLLRSKAELTEEMSSFDVEQQLSSVRKEYQDFVRRHRDDLDRKTVYDTISSHGREDELLFFSTAVCDYNFVLDYWSQRGNWAEALAALAKQKDPEIIYKYSTVLMTHAATSFIDIVMRQNTKVEARRLIPALLSYNSQPSVASIPPSRNQAVRYLLFVINQLGSTDSAVHNTLISLYASHPSKDESSLLNYLESQSPSGSSYVSPSPTTEPSKTTQPSLPYDADFAIRLCIQHARVRSCVHIYSTMGQYVSAVTLALQHSNTDVAIAVAERLEHDAATRKKIWLTIAKSVITGETPESALRTDDNKAEPDQKQPKGLAHKSKPSGQQGATVQMALSLIRRAQPPGTLHIEDLLPLLPDFVSINAVRPEITAALVAYGAQIDELKQEMDDAGATAARLAREERELKGRWVSFEKGQGCGVCGEVLLERRFWVWGCSHGVHADCLVGVVVRRGGRAVESRVREIRAALDGAGSGGDGAGPANRPNGAQQADAKTNAAEKKSQTSKGRRDDLIAELDELLGRECPLCGDMAVRMVDEPFVTPADAKEQAKWAI